MIPFTNEQLERILSDILRAGVIIASLLVLGGGIAFLSRSGAEQSSYTLFRAEPEELTTLSGVLKGVISLEPRSWIQFGLLLLLATPAVRVLFSVLAFAVQKDVPYVVITAVVAAILIYSLLGHHGTPAH